MGIFVNRITRRLCLLVTMSCLRLVAAGLLAQPLPQPERITDRTGLPQAFVPSIVQDRQGFIWAATRDGLCRYDGQRFKVFQPSADGRPSLSFAGVNKLVLDPCGRIWIVSEHGDIDVFDPRTEAFINFSRQPFYQQQIGPDYLQCLYVDRRERVWLAFQNKGLVRIDTRTNQVDILLKPPGKSATYWHGFFKDIVEDHDQQVWIATETSLERYDERRGKLQSYHFDADTKNSPPNDFFTCLSTRANGDLLLGCRQHLVIIKPRSLRYQAHKLPQQGNEWWRMRIVAGPGGAVYISQHNLLFRFNENKPIEIVERFDDHTGLCNSLWIDQSDVLWLGMNSHGIRKYNLRAYPFQKASYQVSFFSDLLTQGLHVSRNQLGPDVGSLPGYSFRYTIDRQQRIWCTSGSSYLYRIDPGSGQTERIPLPLEQFSPATYVPRTMTLLLASDLESRIWLIYEGQLWLFDEQRNRWLPARYQLGRNFKPYILQFVVDRQAIWLASENDGLYRLDRTTGQIRQYAHQPGKQSSLSSNSLYCLSADPTNPDRLWVGTFGSGLCAFDKRTGACRRFTVLDGLPNNVIYSAIPDQQDGLWIGTNQGLCRLNRQTFQTQTFTLEDGLLENEFNRFHSIHLPGRGTANDRIILGGPEGITSFFPRQMLKRDRFEPRVELIGLRVNNQLLPRQLIDSLPIQAVDNLTLAHNQNFITADFAVLQFNSPGKNRYRYRLEGLEDDWKVTDQPVATYTNLPPNDYVLMLNASNTSGQWSRHVRRLAITIRSPFWATWWAYIGYGLLVIGIGYWLIRNSIGWLRMQQSITLKEKENALQHKEIILQQQEAEQHRAVDTLKTNFFTNITHEFRTPLTLILGPAEQMVSENPDPKNRRRLQTIEQNAHQLLRLINQLLDLSKLEASVMPIHESRGDITEFITHWLRPLTDQATGQGLSLSFTSGVTGDYWFDAEKLERIVYNLTANALKFTKVGTIAVSVTALAERIRLTVTDTGVGIPAQHLPHIFDRFYQVGPSLRRTGSASDATTTASADRPGTGIGLALVHELVQLQGGQISVESQLNQGTTFVVELPYRPVDVPETEPGRSAGAVVAPSRREANDDAWTIADESDQPRLLVVEDNDELARFIADSLPEHYRIRRAVNGRDGLEQALEHLPDLVISDVMMPLMDGFTICGQLKTDLRSNHIPIILLTAKASMDNRLAGLALGADDYLTKPFLVAELQLRVRNLLDRQRRQRDRLKTHLTTLPEPAKEAGNEPDNDPFMATIYRLLDTNLDDSTFGADELAAQAGMSRGHLYRKLKALTDLSVNEVIRNYRLKRAGQYLRLGHPVAETGYMVGFESPSYFTKCFRDLYGLPPSDYSTRQN